jgi:hypothetical protein
VDSKDPVWNDQTVHFRLGDGSKIPSAAPLKIVTDAEKKSEVQKGDTVLLIGIFAAIVVSKQKEQKGLNFLRLTDLVEGAGEQGERGRGGYSDDEEDNFHKTVLI